MGRQISFQCAAFGYDVVLYDIDIKALRTAKERIRDYFEDLARSGAMEQGLLQNALERINISDELVDAAKDIDLLSESITEDPEEKGKILSRFNTACPPHTIFTTNTSTLLPSQFAGKTGRAERFAALHFHNTVWEANVVDIMPHTATDPEIVKVLEAFSQSIGQIPILLRQESKGYVFNAMLNGILGSALGLAADDVASAQDIDRSWIGVTKMHVGPFGIMDMIGIDLIYHIFKRRTKWAFFVPSVRRKSRFLKGYIDKGWLGRKSRQGFYAYPNPEFQSANFLNKKTNNTRDTLDSN